MSDYEKIPEEKRTNILMEQTQEQVDELVEILFDNVGRALEREHNLSDLNEISENLVRNAREFQTAAHMIRRKKKIKRIKTILALSGVGAISLIITWRFVDVWCRLLVTIHSHQRREYDRSMKFTKMMK